MKKLLSLETIQFSFDKQAVAVFPNDISELERGITLMELQNRPVIVLIGGHILPEHDAIHKRAIEVIAKTAEEFQAVVICGGTDMGVMAIIGQVRSHERYTFPLVGIAPENMVTWPGVLITNQITASSVGRTTPLEPHHSHFILVPGNEFGDESLWIVRAGTFISGTERKSVTILANGGDVSKKDIELSLDAGRPVIVLRGTGRLADEIAHQPKKNKLITVVRAENRRVLAGAIAALLGGPSHTQ